MVSSRGRDGEWCAHQVSQFSSGAASTLNEVWCRNEVLQWPSGTSGRLERERGVRRLGARGDQYCCDWRPRRQRQSCSRSPLSPHGTPEDRQEGPKPVGEGALGSNAQRIEAHQLVLTRVEDTYLRWKLQGPDSPTTDPRVQG